MSNDKPTDAGTLTLVLDEPLAGAALRDARAAGMAVQSLPDMVGRGATDEAVCSALGGRPDHVWVVRDRELRYRPTVVTRLRAAGVSAFVLTAAGNRTLSELGAMLQAAWPRLQRFAARTSRPFVARVDRTGTPHLRGG